LANGSSESGGSDKEGKGLKTWPVPSLPAQQYAIGDKVYYRWKGGGCANSDSHYIMPIWFPATVKSLSSDERQIHLQVEDWPHHSYVWNVAAKPSELLHEFDINASSSICWVPDVFIAFQREMAKQNKYLDYSLDAWTQLQVLWPDDGQLYVARVMCWTDVNWQDALDSALYDRYETIGPYVPVFWVGERKYSIMPKGDLVFSSSQTPSLTKGLKHTMEKAAENAVEVAAASFVGPRGVLLASLQSAGKILCDAREEWGVETVTCLWHGDCQWYDAILLECDQAEVEDLAAHVRYDLPER
jgi:hypothetical protein